MSQTQKPRQDLWMRATPMETVTYEGEWVKILNGDDDDDVSIQELMAT